MTDLPFRVTESSIVVVKAAPCLQCGQCGEAELEQAATGRVDELLAGMGSTVELAVIRYA